MYVVIVGCGKIGYSLAKALTVTEHEVLVIDRDSQRCEVIEEELGSVAIIGDGCEAGVLEEAGIVRADVFIAVTGNDEDNLVACQLATNRFGVAKTIARVTNPSNEGLFKLLGVDVTISSTQLILSHIEEELPANPLVHVMPIAGTNKELVGIKIPAEASVVGKTLEEIALPDGTLISLIISREGGTSLPLPDTLVNANDEIVAVTTVEGEEALWESLTRVG